MTLLVAITSGMAVWLFQGNNELTVGASGLIFGYFGYVLSRGLIDRNLIDALAAVVMGAVLRLHPDGGDTWDPRRELDRSPGRAGRRNRRRLDLPDPAALRGETTRDSGDSGGRPPASTVAVPTSPDHPRADLYKELGDLGL